MFDIQMTLLSQWIAFLYLKKKLKKEFWIVSIHAAKIWGYLNENWSNYQITKYQFLWNTLCCEHDIRVGIFILMVFIATFQLISFSIFSRFIFYLVIFIRSIQKFPARSGFLLCHSLCLKKCNDPETITTIPLIPRHLESARKHCDGNP